MSSPFDAEFGNLQGRIEPSGWNPTDGDWAFVLGSDTLGRFNNFELGDYIEVRQLVDLTGVNFIRLDLRLRGASEMPSSVGWIFSITLGGTPTVERILEPGITKDLFDVAVNVSKITGNTLVGFRLTLDSV